MYPECRSWLTTRLCERKMEIRKMKKIASAICSVMLLLTMSVGAYAACCDDGSKCCNGTTCCKSHHRK